MSTVSLGALRLQAQDRTDLENSPNISTAMWNQYISMSYKELYDLLVAAYGNDYYVQTPYQFNVGGSQLYSLPSDFYKLLGVDLQYSGSPSGWVSLKKFEFLERNKYSYLNPIALSSGVAQLWYIPQPTSLQFIPSCSTTLGSAVVTADNVTGLTVGMAASGNAVQNGATILSINTGTKQVTLSSVVQATQNVVPIFFWNDGVTIDGIAGWEEYIIVDAAIKANIKQEQAIEELVELKKAMKARLEAMAEGRDAGQAHHVTDALSVNSSLMMNGPASLKYRLLGSQIQLIPCASESNGDAYDSWGGF